MLAVKVHLVVLSIPIMSDEKTELCDEVDFHPIFLWEKSKWQYDTIIEFMFPIIFIFSSDFGFQSIHAILLPNRLHLVFIYLFLLCWAISVSVILSLEDPRLNPGMYCETKVEIGPTPLKHERDCICLQKS